MLPARGLMLKKAQRLGLWIAGATLVLTGAGVLVAVAGSDGGVDVTSGGDANAAENGSNAGSVERCGVLGNGNVVNCGGGEPQPVDPNAGDAEAEQDLRGDTDPQGDGPWAFNVLFDNDEGIFIRNVPEMAGGHRIGYATSGSVVWVDCVVTSTFDPEPGLGHGPIWYRVRWPNTALSEEAFVSDPNHPPQGYAWSFYLRPNGTNGDVPQCDAA